MKLLRKETLLKMIENSIGSSFFRNLYARTITSRKKDVLQDGEYSCAFYVSCLLTLLGLISRPHATVKGATEDLVMSGWKEVDSTSLREGDVLVWNAIKYNSGSAHKHIGFYIGHDVAVSTSVKKKSPQMHHSTYGGKRKIEKVLRYVDLMKPLKI